MAHRGDSADADRGHDSEHHAFFVACPQATLRHSCPAQRQGARFGIILRMNGPAENLESASHNDGSLALVRRSGFLFATTSILLVALEGFESAPSGQILVKTEVKTKRRGRPYTVAVDYLLRKDGGKHRAFDVFTDGVGLVENYRAQFGKLISKYGMDGLLKRRRKKLAKS